MQPSGPQRRPVERDVLSRTVRWITEQVPFLLVVAMLLGAFGYLIVEPGHWVRGSGVVAVAVLVAGVLRAVLPTVRVGMLAVRSRPVDALLYLILGGLILGVDIRLHG
jgi:Protein of unknown function (DUF3017)